MERKSAKRALMVIEIAGTALLLAWTAKTYVAGRLSRTTARRNLELAAKLDPSNSDFQLQLGRYFEYSVSDLDTGRAIEHLKRATELNPHDPQAWIDLGAALEFQGRTAEAEACLRRAGSLAPKLPSYHWIIGNFFLLHGNVDEAFRHFQVVLAGSLDYNQVLFETAWRASGDDEKILRKVIPDDVSILLSYLNYLLTRRRYASAQRAWDRIISLPQTFPPRIASGYIDALIQAHRSEEAYAVWTDLQKKGVIPPDLGPRSANLITNADFEQEPLEMGFDWRFVPLKGVYVGRDQSTFHSPGHALLIQFSGTENVSYRHVFQYARVHPGRSYQLRAFVKTEGITTDSGPRLEVQDAYDPNALDQATEGLTGDTKSWVTLELQFRIGPKTKLVVVNVARPPSRKFDNLIAGRVWVDDFSLSEVSP